MIETHVLMTVSDFSGFFSRNHFLEGASFFNEGCFSDAGLHFYVVVGGGGFEKNHRMGGGGPPDMSPPPTTMGNPVH